MRSLLCLAAAALLASACGASAAFTVRELFGPAAAGGTRRAPKESPLHTPRARGTKRRRRLRRAPHAPPSSLSLSHNNTARPPGPVILLPSLGLRGHVLRQLFQSRRRPRVHRRGKGHEEQMVFRLWLARERKVADTRVHSPPGGRGCRCERAGGRTVSASRACRPAGARPADGVRGRGCLSPSSRNPARSTCRSFRPPPRPFCFFFCSHNLISFYIARGEQGSGSREAPPVFSCKLQPHSVLDLSISHSFLQGAG